MELISVLVFGVLIVISPGADFVLVFKNSVEYGRKAGLLTAFGIGIGVCVHVTYSIVGISHFISQNDVLFDLVKYAGSAYLIYLGVSGFFSSKLNVNDQTEEKNTTNKLNYFTEGLLCNVLNPKTMLFFLSVFSQLISSDNDSGTFVIVYGLYIAVLHGIWFSFVSLFVTSNYASDVFQRFGRRINQICGMGLILFGVVLALKA
ncbi:LysE family translocator [Marinomonas sp. 2405UD68-3]|uniref:LysE family translocator n=1 Tax=Marinomonas sp. 2405UD68-3 TaxID=3391835 RepID=UPI0039C91322